MRYFMKKRLILAIFFIIFANTSFGEINNSDNQKTKDYREILKENKINNDPVALVNFITRKLSPEEFGKINGLIDQLSAVSFEDREEAEKKLLEIDIKYLDMISKGTGKTDPENIFRRKRIVSAHLAKAYENLNFISPLRASLMALGVFKDSSHLKIYESKIRDTNPRIRRGAAEGLGFYNTKEAADILGEAIKNDSDPNNKIYYMKILAKFDNNLANAYIYECTKSTNSNVYALAYRMLCEMHDPQSLDYFIKSYKSLGQDQKTIIYQVMDIKDIKNPNTNFFSKLLDNTSDEAIQTFINLFKNNKSVGDKNNLLLDYVINANKDKAKSVMRFLSSHCDSHTFSYDLFVKLIIENKLSNDLLASFFAGLERSVIDRNKGMQQLVTRILSTNEISLDKKVFIAGSLITSQCPINLQKELEKLFVSLNDENKKLLVGTNSKLGRGYQIPVLVQAKSQVIVPFLIKLLDDRQYSNNAMYNLQRMFPENRKFRNIVDWKNWWSKQNN